MKKLTPVLLALCLVGCGVSEEDVAKISADTVEESADDAYQPTSSTGCIHAVGSTDFKFQTVTYSNGDKFVMCSITNPSEEFSDSVYYLSDQAGAETESCLLGYDLESDSGGYFRFKISEGARSATYVDSSSDNNGLTVNFATSDCITAD